MAKKLDTHPFAFRRILYQCSTCSREDIIWNSRDGAIPFSITCSTKSCKGVMSNTKQVLGPKTKIFKPPLNTRYFVDMTKERAQHLAELEVDRLIALNPERANEADALAAKLAQSFYGNGQQPDLLKRT